jgi:uncharacterized protein YbjT (DUF2867 family)
MGRPPDLGRDLVEAAAELVEADLTRPETLDDALHGVRAVVATANVVTPLHRGDTEKGLTAGYAALVDRARAAGVERFVYARVPAAPLDDTAPTARAERQVERLRVPRQRDPAVSGGPR